MSKEKEQAFPCYENSLERGNAQTPGVTKLELFSAMAMQGLVVNYLRGREGSPVEVMDENDERMTIAQLSVIAAKSLLAELEKEQA